MFLIIGENFAGNIHRPVFTLLKSSANIFAYDSNAEKLYTAKKQNQNNDGCIAHAIEILDEIY